MKHGRIFKPQKPRTAYRAAAQRQRAFLARLPTAGRVAAQVSPIDRVLRRALAPVPPNLTAIVQLVLRFAHSFTHQQHMHHTLRPITPIAPVARPALLHLVERRMAFVARVIESRSPARSEALAAEPAALQRERIERQIRVPRISMTIVRPAASAAARLAEPAPAETKAQASAHAVRAFDAVRGAEPAPLTLAAQELSRVTDHVIRQLDRRVLSYHERTGRI